jgi:hypothetical protein
MNLPGSVQTVPRAELHALQHLLNEATENANVEFITDNKKNCDTFNKGIFAGTKNVNHDLFKRILGCIAEKHLIVTVRWMPSHLQDKMSADENFQLPEHEHVSLNDVKGNQWADELAGDSAKSFEVPLKVSSPYLYHKSLTKRIQRRLMVIWCSLPNRPKHIPKASIPKESFEELCNVSKHIIYKIGDDKHIGCARCKQIKLIKGAGIKFWLDSACSARRSDDCMPIVLNREFTQMGNLSIHHTHKPYVYKGVYFIKCGCCATNKLKKLASECGVRTVAGQRFLNEINMGHLPESANINALSPNTLTNIEQDTLTAVQNDLDPIENNVQIIHESENETLYSPLSALVGCDSDSD